MSDAFPFHADDSLQREISGLVAACLAATATDADWARLEELVAGDAAARGFYLDFMHDSLMLRRWATADADWACSAVPSDPVVCSGLARASGTGIGIFGSLYQGTISYFSQTGPLSYLIATIIMFTMGIVAWNWRVPEHTSVAIVVPPAHADKHVDELANEFVGRITGMVDCEWADSHTAVPGLVAVPLGRKYALASGLLEITYDSGARVILQGPCIYQVDATAGGYLFAGKLVARVEKKVESRESRAENTNQQSPNPKSQIVNSSQHSTLDSRLFTVTTPTATVTDLGTEFGVEVSEKGATTSRVFQGVVKVELVGGDEASKRQVMELREGQSVRVEGHDARCVTVVGEAAEQSDFVREMPKQAMKVLDLVDVVAGGDGFSGRRDRGIDPATGRISDHSPTVYFPTVAGDYQYHRAEGNGLVDGVFIPNGEAGVVQVDSAGHTFDGFGRTDNLTYGQLWAGGRIAPVNAPDAIRTSLRGVDDFASPGHGLLLLHANSGVTFDLDAIRRKTGGRILRLRAVGGNAATFTDVARIRADLWVLVDGKQRLVRHEEPGRGDPIYISVPLKRTDRFLTLAFTDGGDGCGWDWTLLGDPQLDLVLTEPAADFETKRRKEQAQ